MFLRKKLFKTVNIFFFFALTFSFGIQVLTFNWTKLDSFYLKIHVLRVNFGWILPRFWRKDMKILALYTSLPIVRVNSRKFRVYSRKLRVYSRNTRYFAKNIFFPYEIEPNEFSFAWPQFWLLQYLNLILTSNNTLGIDKYYWLFYKTD